MSNSEGQVGAPIANFRTHYLAFYIQDNWRVTPKLTVNLGLRWENESPYYDKHDAAIHQFGII
jgi:outer membrane receptor protein involved in Fe transport